eukprot:COSAG03_NODE_3275_length_2110_cov_1.096967_1_plen_54_part_10
MQPRNPREGAHTPLRLTAGAAWCVTLSFCAQFPRVPSRLGQLLDPYVRVTFIEP